MRKIRLVALFIFILISASCTHTRVVSFTDPDAGGKYYNRIAVVGTVEDLSDRLAIEKQMVKTLLENDVNAISSLSLLPPTRDFTLEQENEIFKNNNVEALVLIQIDNSGYMVSTEPMRINTETRKKGGKKVKRTTVSGGGTEHKAFSQLRVSLVDMESNKTMWIGDVDARAFFDSIDPDWDMELLLKASSKKIAKELLKTGLVKY